MAWGSGWLHLFLIGFECAAAQALGSRRRALSLRAATGGLISLSEVFPCQRRRWQQTRSFFKRAHSLQVASLLLISNPKMFPHRTISRLEACASAQIFHRGVVLPCDKQAISQLRLHKIILGKQSCGASERRDGLGSLVQINVTEPQRRRDLSIVWQHLSRPCEGV